MNPRLLSFAFGSAFCLLSASAPAFARPFRVNQIPNGSVNGCANCHVDPAGGGPRNPFGTQIETGFLVPPGSSGNVQWGATLAGLNADGDGRTNGAELGDPAGAWSVGQPQPGVPSQVTNPGIAQSFPVPALSPPAVALLAALLVGVAMFVRRRRSPIAS